MMVSSVALGRRGIDLNLSLGSKEYEENMSMGSKECQEKSGTAAEAAGASAAAPAPLTIFYRGSVWTFDSVQPNIAKALMIVAGRSAIVNDPQAHYAQARRGSLQRFLQKRRERVGENYPYPKQNTFVS